MPVTALWHVCVESGFAGSSKAIEVVPRFFALCIFAEGVLFCITRFWQGHPAVALISTNTLSGGGRLSSERHSKKPKS